MSKKQSDAIESENSEKQPRKRLGFLDGKYPPISLEDLNASNDEIASWFYDDDIFPSEEEADPAEKLTSASSPSPRTD